MTLLSDIVATSQRVGATAARLGKLRELAACLRRLDPGEIGIGVHYLSGETRQGRFGIGYAALQAAGADVAADRPALELPAVDRRLAGIAAVRGAGSAAKRSDLLRELFALATRDEREFLIRLLLGELRQGALAGIMVDAIAAASGVDATQVRRAAMYARDLGAVASAALLEGSGSLATFRLELLSPVAPMLAQTAQTVADAFKQLDGEVAFETHGIELPTSGW